MIGISSPYQGTYSYQMKLAGPSAISGTYASGNLMVRNLRLKPPPCTFKGIRSLQLEVAVGLHVKSHVLILKHCVQTNRHRRLIFTSIRLRIQTTIVYCPSRFGSTCKIRSILTQIEASSEQSSSSILSSISFNALLIAWHLGPSMTP